MDPWATPDAQANDYAPVNIGQVKAVAAKVYDCLIELHFASGYPWPAPSAATNDFARANPGQVKALFAFD